MFSNPGSDPNPFISTGALKIIHLFRIILKIFWNFSGINRRNEILIIFQYPGITYTSLMPRHRIRKYHALFPLKQKPHNLVWQNPHGDWCMYQMRKLAFLVILAGMFVVPVFADIAVEGRKQYSYQYLLNNSSDNPDYIFLTSSEIWGFDQPSVVVNGTFGGGYKLDGFVLHAIKEADLDPLIRERLKKEEQDRTDLSEYFSSLPLVTADVSLPVATSMDEKIPLNNITVLLQINSISDFELNVTKAKIIYGFENGTTINQEFQEDSDELQPGIPGA
jgi:hypothetical protein